MTAASQFTRETRRAWAAALLAPAQQDSVFLGLVIGLSLVLYVTRLGFYSDDWVFLSLLAGAERPTLLGLYQALYAGDVVIRQRPAQVAYLAVLYRLVGAQPLAYHLANSSLLMAASVLFYHTLRQLRQPRYLAVATALVFGLLPHYSTDRFWVAAHQATLSITLYFLSLYATLRALGGGRVQFGAWIALSLISLVGSGLAYEVALPMFVLNPLLAWYVNRTRPAAPSAPPPGRFEAALLFGSHLAALLGVLAFKAAVTVRANVTADLWSHVAGVVAGALRVTFGTYGLGLPYVLAWIAGHDPQWPTLALAGGAGVLTYGYLVHLGALPGEALPGNRDWLAMVGLGFVVFTLGYTVFIVNTDVWFTSTSLGNRVAIAAAIGMALTMVGGLGWLSARWPRAQRQVFGLGIALLAAGSLAITNTLAAFWDAAYQQQQAIVADIRAHVPRLPAESTLILDGVCLERGGAYAFTGKRDVAAVLALAYGDDSLDATAITNPPELGAEGIRVVNYGSGEFFTYSEHLFVYNFSTKALQLLPEAASARRYFEGRSFAPERDCAPGFAWGWNTP